jgi:hypothetical protein
LRFAFSSLILFLACELRKTGMATVMEKYSKELLINGRTYRLDLIQHPDANWECGISRDRSEVVSPIQRHASAYEVKALAHMVAYELEYIRRDMECEAECQEGWIPS